MNISLVNLGCPSRAIVFLMLVPVIAMLLYHAAKMKKAFRILSSSTIAGVTLAHIRFLLKAFFIILGTSFLIFSLLRPQWDKKEEVTPLYGRDVVVALDISRSMLCQDVSPNRLESAKLKINYLVNKLSSDRKALLLFAGAPFVICPLTHDHDSFMMFLKQIDASTISSAGTSLDKALKEAIDMLKQMEGRKTKIITLFTDGEDFSDSLKSIEKEIADYGLQVFIVCMGTKEGGPIPLYDAKGTVIGHQKNKNGAVVITKSQYDTMKQLVSSVSGVCIEGTHDMKDVEQIVKLIEAYEKEQLAEHKKEIFQEKYHYSAAISFILLAVAFLL